MNKLLRLLDELERAVGKPVLTANQVTVWESLRLVPGLPARRGAGGSLFAQGTLLRGAGLA